MRKHTIWTDGSCLGNPGYGGWSAIFFKSAFGLDYPTPHMRLCGSEIMTTNNRMEMQAIIVGLNCVEPDSHIRIVTDSAYCADGATKWHEKWILREWKGVANVDLWHQLLSAIKRHKIVEFKLVKGHSRVEWNEHADDLAKSAAKALRQIELEGVSDRFVEIQKRLKNGGDFADLAK